MKLLKLTTYVLLLCTAILFSSCKKGRFGATKNVTVNATVAAGVDYQLNLAQYGDADDVATITAAPVNASVSRIDNAAAGFAPVYHYTGDAGKFADTDKAVITVSEVGRGGRCHKGDETIITINFTIE